MEGNGNEIKKYYLPRIAEAFRKGDFAEAERLQAKMAEELAELFEGDLECRECGKFYRPRLEGTEKKVQQAYGGPICRACVGEKNAERRIKTTSYGRRLLRAVRPAGVAGRGTDKSAPSAL